MLGGGGGGGAVGPMNAVAFGANGALLATGEKRPTICDESRLAFKFSSRFLADSWQIVGIFSGGADGSVRLYRM